MADENSNLVMRRITYKLYPSLSQVKALLRHLQLHQQLYNACLQQRIEAWRRQRKSLSYAEQCKELTALRHDDLAYRQINCHASQETLKRLDLAFRAFFARVKKKGAAAGFPRFKALDRYPGWSYKDHGDGFKFLPGADWKNGKLVLQHIGTIKARGQARTGGRIVKCDIIRKTDGWYLSLVVECQPARTCGTGAVGYDWGTKTLLAIAKDEAPNGAHEFVPNPRLFKKAEKQLRRDQRAVARCKPRSNRRKKQ